MRTVFQGLTVHGQDRDQFLRRWLFQDGPAVYLLQLVPVAVDPDVGGDPGESLGYGFDRHTGAGLDHGADRAHLWLLWKTVASRLNSQAENIVAGLVAPTAQFGYSALDRVYGDHPLLLNYSCGDRGRSFLGSGVGGGIFPCAAAAVFCCIAGYDCVVFLAGCDGKRIGVAMTKTVVAKHG